MNGIETADIRPQRLDQGQVITDSESVEERPSRLTAWPSMSPLPTIPTPRAPRAPYNADRNPPHHLI